MRIFRAGGIEGTDILHRIEKLHICQTGRAKFCIAVECSRISGSINKACVVPICIITKQTTDELTDGSEAFVYFFTMVFLAKSKVNRDHTLYLEYSSIQKRHIHCTRFERGDKERQNKSYHSNQYSFLL